MSEQESYAVGDLVEVDLASHGNKNDWHLSRVERIYRERDGLGRAQGTVGKLRWDFFAGGGSIRTPAPRPWAAPPHTWKVGDECEVLRITGAWTSSKINKITDSIAYGTFDDYNDLGRSWSRSVHGPELRRPTGTRAAEQPADPADPLDAVIDGVRLRTLLDGDEFNRRESSATYRAKPMSIAQRAAVSAHWSAQLRARVAASKDRDKRQVTYCEVDADD